MKKFQTLVFSIFSIFIYANVSNASPFDLNLSEHAEIEKFINQKNMIIQKNPNSKESANQYILRGDALFLLGKFDEAVRDYSYALKLDVNKNEAYFGKGLALGRYGRIEEGIAELDVYIKWNPNSSLAYTKRGIRRLWLGEQDEAQKDFERALDIAPSNAEAHDDLGVIFSRKKMYFEAADHFLSAIEYDPTYQKAYHNLALISFLTEKDELALGFVNSAIKLNPSSRDTLLLKSQILSVLGFVDDAKKLQEEAEFLPEGNWSESVPIQ